MSLFLARAASSLLSLLPSAGALSLLLPPPPAAFPFVLFRWLACFCLFCCPVCLTLLFATPLPCRLLSFLVFLSGVWSGLPCFSGCFLSVLLLWRPCGTAWGARKQQSLRTWIVFPFCGSEAIWLAHSSGEWYFFWISWLTQWCCYAAMHCRYFAETKTLWEHLNSPAATTQVLRPRVYGYGKHVI